MTVVTIVAAGDVGWVFSYGRQAIVAGATRSHYLRMVYHVDRRKDVRVVAVFTDCGRLDMGRIFANRRRTVMAARTVVADINVIKIRRYPANG